MDEWYYQRGEATFGPISNVMLHGLHKRGRLQDDTRVRKSGEEGWRPLTQVIASLPALPDSPSASFEPYTNAQPFDASHPAASVIYAPPQSALEVQPEIKLPAKLWCGMIFCSLALLFEMICWAFVVMQLSHAFDAAHLREWIPASHQPLEERLAYQMALFATIISSISVAVWQGCAFASLKRLYGGDMVRRSCASGLWWFVPIASLFMPMLCLRDMRHFSRRRRDVINLHVPFGPLLILMEVLIMVRIPLNIFEATKSGGAGSHASLEFVSDSALIALAATLLAIVIRNFLQQRKLYTHWRDEAYWQNPAGQ